LQTYYDRWDSSFPKQKDIWMRDKGDHYEYVAVYVDDLLIASREPQSIITALETTHKFKLKGSGPTDSIWDATSFVTNMED
jgi:hypothetical protein